MARIGYSIYVYDIAGSKEAHAQIRRIYKYPGLNFSVESSPEDLPADPPAKISGERAPRTDQYVRH